MTPDQLALYAGIAGGIIAVVAGTWKASTMLARGFRRINHFLDDWFGEPAHGGQPARAGIPERLGAVETRTAQLEPNGGAHMSDRVKRIEDGLSGLTTKVDQLVTNEANRNGRAPRWRSGNPR